MAMARLILRRNLVAKAPLPKDTTFRELAVGEFFLLKDQPAMGLKEKIADEAYATYWTPITTSMSFAPDPAMAVTRSCRVEEVDAYLTRTAPKPKKKARRKVHG
jgi:hypothetical protein